MYEVTCPGCHRAVEITPEASACPACGEELQQLLLPDQVADYFLARVQTLSQTAAFDAALVAVERGLGMIASSHLHLTAAILAKQTGRYEVMRRHVAAIPVDDALRGEAEWLLRSQRTQRVRRHAPAPPSTFLDDLLGRNNGPAIPPRRSRIESIGPIVAILILGGMLFVGWAEWGDALVPRPPQTAAPRATLQATPLTAVEPPTTPRAGGTRNLLPAPTPTPAIPPHMVVAGDESVETADADLRRVVVIASTGFDLPGYLRENGYPQLAELGVSARLQDGTLILQGIVHQDIERRQLIQLMREMPGVQEVNAIDLLLRPLPVYVVQEGDTLWTIVAAIYGDVTRMDAFIAYNRDVLPSPDALVPGMELKVLPIR